MTASKSVTGVGDDDILRYTQVVFESQEMEPSRKHQMVAEVMANYMGGGDDKNG